jgi:hypothetical protein
MHRVGEQALGLSLCYMFVVFLLARKAVRISSITTIRVVMTLPHEPVAP